MPIARRDLLGLGASAALALAASACGGPVDGTARSPRPAPTTAGTPAQPRPTRAPQARATEYAGRPAPGHLYFGASLPAHRSVTAWEATLGTTLSLHRSYFRPDHNETAQLARQCVDDLAHDRLPHVSIKPLGTWADVASGRSDEWLNGLLHALAGQRGPVFLTLHHEPENDAGPPGMQAPDYVAMQRRVIGMAADLAPQVTVVPILQHWSFEPLRPSIDPEAWIVREAAVLGIDVYNPWSVANGKRWRSFGSRVDEVLRWIGDTPLAIGEYGCREDPADPEGAADWLRDAAEYARTHGIVSMSYFNSGNNAPDGSLELHGRTERAFADLLASEWVARPS